MTAARTPATMGAHVVTWSMTSTVTVKTGGKERPATRVSDSWLEFCLRPLSLSVFCEEGWPGAHTEIFLLQVTANVMRPRATMAAPAMTKEMLSSACVLEAGKEQPAT